MPQIDLLSYFSVGFYTGIFFLMLIFFLYHYILPEISMILKMRNRIHIDKKLSLGKKVYARKTPISENLIVIKNSL